MNIAEIAKLAGVSRAAVSRYFNQGYISEEKREAIRKAVEETGYRPSPQAQTLRTGRTHIVGVIMPRVNSTPVGNMIKGMLSELNRNGYQLLLADTQNDPAKELEYLFVFDEKQVDGIILMGTIFSPAHRKALRKLELPLVIMGQRMEGRHCVYFDDYRSVLSTTRLLIDKGCQRIGFLSAFHADEAAGRERYRGFCDALKANGMVESQRRYEIADFSLESGYEKVQVLWKKHGPLDGLVCATDEIATGALQYLKEAGIRVPQDVLVTGHGNTELSQVTTPTLTTVHYEYQEGGVRAARMLLEQMEGIGGTVEEMMLGYRVVERESTGGCAKSM